MPHVWWNRQTEKSEPKKEKMMYRNSDISNVIDEYVHNQEHRKILKSRFIDGLTYDELANTYPISVRQLKRIIYKYDKILIKMAQKRHV